MNRHYIEARRTEIVAVDFETTGALAGHENEPWQVGLVGLRNGAVQAQSSYESLLHVGERPFNPWAPGRHAQLRAELAAAPEPGELWPELEARLCGRALAAHNIGTERTILARLAPLHQLGPWIDTLALTRHAWPRLASKALSDVIDALGLAARVMELCPGREPHDALYDAFACAVLLEYLLGLPGWERVTVEALASCR